MSLPELPSLDELWPDGTFGHAHSADARPAAWTTAEQARHRADLVAALAGWRDPSERAERDRARHWPRPSRPTTERTAA